MKERGYSVKALKTCGTALRGCVGIKHSDRFTRGIPDFSITWLGFTNWVESKVVRKGQSLRDVIDQDQIIMCSDLATATDGRCWVVVFDEAIQRTTIWSPRFLGLILIQKAQSAEVVRAMQQAQDALDLDEWGDINLAAMVKANGAICFAGLHPQLVAKLIASATLLKK